MKKRKQAGTDVRGGRRNRKLRRYKRSILMICVVLVCLTGALAVSSVRLQAKNAQYKAQEAELEETDPGRKGTCRRNWMNLKNMLRRMITLKKWRRTS